MGHVEPESKNCGGQQVKDETGHMDESSNVKKNFDYQRIYLRHFIIWSNLCSVHWLCHRCRPRNGGMYCVGRRMKFRSCNSEPCSKQKKDFREEQCAAFDGRHFNINGLPPNVRWVPKYSGSENLVFTC